MLTPEPMLEVNLFVFERDLEPVTAALARLEALHLEDVKAEAWLPAHKWEEVAERFSKLTQRLEELMRTLKVSAEPGTAPDDLRIRDWAEIDAEARALEQRVSDWQSRLASLQKKIQQLDLACANVRLLVPLDVPVQELTKLNHLHLVIGTLPSENLRRVKAALFQVTFVLIALYTKGDRTVVLASTSEEHAAVLDRALRSAFLEPIELPADARGLARDVLPSLETQLIESRREAEELRRWREQVMEEIGPQLSKLYRRAQAGARLAQAIRRFPCHNEMYLIPGWVPARHVAALERASREAAGSRVVIEVLEPDPSRAGVPTLVSAPRWLRPFQPLVTTFGLSAYDELDPTIIAAAAFLLMYGMMFGDVGHSALLVMAGLWLRARSPLLGVAVVAAGLSGILFGLLYGTAFGFETMHPIWLRPMNEMRTLLLTAVAGGAALLNLAFVLNLVNAWRNKDWRRFFLEKNGLVGIALYWTLLGGGAGIVLGFIALGTWLPALSLQLLLLWVREPLSARIWGGEALPLAEALLTGFFELIEAIIGYLANTLSFIRLGAFAVAHEGLSRAVIAYSSGGLDWLLFILGTALIVGFEGLIVGIQALRLEYYEFFGRFFRGTGKPFVPLSLQGGQDATVRIWN